ncbi:MAG: peptidase [Acidobacteriota bacterium]|jgi:hypothetical protein|nr:peptidase [Acidobacteriota bacterium]
MKQMIWMVAAALSLFFCACDQKPATAGGTEPAVAGGESLEMESLEYLDQQLAKLAPVEIDCFEEGLSDGDKKALPKLVAAAEVMDEIFLCQVYARNREIRAALEASAAPAAQKALRFFAINFGPFDRINHDHPFIGDRAKPEGANFYPEDMAKTEFLEHIKIHPEDETAFTSNFTLIRRREGGLVAVPYSEAYAAQLGKAAGFMREAAARTENPSLKKYLLSRAAAFQTDDYRRSDMDWMDLTDHDLEVVIGPYEVYEDALFGYKAAFESFITRVDREESAKLARISKYTDELEKHLPIDDQFKNFTRGKSSPIIVANEIFTAGDTKAGVQTTAFNLPNDEYVREKKGSKKVMLKNIARAKFDNCWMPIVREVLADAALKQVSFDAYFNHVLMHEISHGLGPGTIEIAGRTTTVSRELKELYAVIEETKADILGLWNLLYLVDKGEFPAELREKIFSTYLGGIFRSVRFGIGEAHGGANAIQLNYILEKGGFVFNEDETRFGVVAEAMPEAVRQLSHEVLMIQARGDYAAAAAFIREYRRLDPRLQRALDKVKHVPIDILPRYAAEKYLQTGS